MTERFADAMNNIAIKRLRDLQRGLSRLDPNAAFVAGNDARPSSVALTKAAAYT